LGIFTEKDLTLFSALANQAAITIEKARLQQEEIEKQLLEQQMNLAHQIQKGFWPKRLSGYEGIEFAGMNVPAIHVGGDYYDFIPLNDNQCAMVIGDVSGKGVSAALLMATLRAALRAQIENNHLAAETILLVNNMLVKDTPPEKFMTLFYGVLDITKRKFTYVNAGHNPPILYDRHTTEIKRLTAGGSVIGFLENFQFKEDSEKLCPGQVMVLYTDGVTEAQSPAEEMFGEERLETLIRQHADENAQELMERIYQAVTSFTQETTQYDDITLVVMKVENS